MLIKDIFVYIHYLLHVTMDKVDIKTERIEQQAFLNKVDSQRYGMDSTEHS